MFKNLDISNPGITSEEIIDFVRNEKIATYNYRKIKSSGISLIAQNVLKYDNISKYLLSNFDDKYSVNLYSYVSMLHVALQEEMKKTEELEKQNKALSDRVAALEDTVKRLVEKVE